MNRLWKGFSSYTVIGIANTVIHWQLFFVFRAAFEFSQAMSNLFAFCVAASFSFYMNALYTFAMPASAAPLWAVHVVPGRFEPGRGLAGRPLARARAGHGAGVFAGEPGLGVPAFAPGGVS